MEQLLLMEARLPDSDSHHLENCQCIVISVFVILFFQSIHNGVSIIVDCRSHSKTNKTDPQLDQYPVSRVKSVLTLYPAPGPVKHEDIVKDLVGQAGTKESQFTGYIPVSELTVANTRETGVD